MNIPLSPCVPENLVSRDGFSRPVSRQPAHLHTQAESGAYLRDSSRVPRRRPFMNRHTPSGQSRVFRVTQLRTDGVHYRESAGTGPVTLKVVPNEGYATCIVQQLRPRYRLDIIGGRLYSTVCMTRCGLRAAFMWLGKSKTIKDYVLYHATIVSKCTRQCAYPQQQSCAMCCG